MRRLVNKQNVYPADSDYPYGRVKDDDGTGTGTPVNEQVYGDFHQFFERMMAQSDLVANELPDSEYVRFQLFEAFLECTSKRIGKFSTADSLAGAVTNLNSFFKPGLFYITSSYTNIPTGMGATALLTIGGYSNPLVQKVTSLVNYAEWVRTWDGSVWSAWALVKPAVKTVQIGDWNMDSTATVDIAHGLTDITKIIDVSVIIISDNSLTVRKLEQPNLGSMDGGVNSIGTVNIQLFRLTGGAFDSTSFDQTPFNRGRITIEYDPG